jgi:hypothetical protein
MWPGMTVDFNPPSASRYGQRKGVGAKIKRSGCRFLTAGPQRHDDDHRVGWDGHHADAGARSALGDAGADQGESRRGSCLEFVK